MKIQAAIVHEQNPGSDPQHLVDQLATFCLPNSQIGIEIDVTLKKCGADTSYVPVALSRDRSIRIGLAEHINAFMNHGFSGPFFLDLIDRRASASVIKVIGEYPGQPIYIQVPEMALAYKTPKVCQNNLFEVEDSWQNAWPQLTISSRFPHLVREFLDYGQRVNLFWEPVASDDYRRDLTEIVRRADFILYKMPHLTYTAKFDPDICLERDLDFFNSVAKDMVVAPMGSVELLKMNGHKLFGSKNSHPKGFSAPMHVEIYSPEGNQASRLS